MIIVPWTFTFVLKIDFVRETLGVTSSFHNKETRAVLFLYINLKINTNTMRFRRYYAYKYFIFFLSKYIPYFFNILQRIGIGDYITTMSSP